MSGRQLKRRRLAVVIDSSDSDVECEKIEYGDRSSSRRRLSDDSCEASTSREAKRVCHSSDEQKSNDDSELSLASCRLRHGLNEDCLCEIFKYLGVYDLIQLCELDIYYQNLISKWVIGKKLINFTKMDPCWTTNKIFQVFGKTMRKIKIAEENTLLSFERFLTFVIQYCSVGTLTEIELRFSAPSATRAIMEEAMPYFSNLRKLVLNDNYTRVSYKEFLAGISTAASNMTHLTLEGVNVSGEWLLAGGMDNLRELRIHTSKRRSMSIQTIELAEFLRTKSKLELFSYIGNDDIKPVVDTLTQHCPQLKTFADFHLINPHRRELSTINDQMKQRYSFVRRFTGVTTIGLTAYTQCGSDLFYPLTKMAAQNKVQELKIYIDRDQAIKIGDDEQMHYVEKAFGHFTSLKSVEIQVRSEISEQCDLNVEFICEFISKQSNVVKLCVMSEHAIRNINKIIDIAPNINQLGVAQVKMKYLPVEMRKIIKSIRKRRAQQINDGQTNPKPFHISVSEQQWRELSVYKDVDTILTTTIENSNGCQTFKVTGP